MDNQTGTLEYIAIYLSRLFNPLSERLTAGQVQVLFAELGLQFPAQLNNVAPFQNAAQSAIVIIDQLPTLATDLVTAIEDEDGGQIISKSLELLDVIRRIMQNVDALAAALKNAGAATGLPAPDVTQFANELPQRLLEYLIARNLEILPGAADVLDFIGVLKRTSQNVGSVDPAKPPFTRRELHFDKLTDFLQDPLNYLNATYGWGSPGFNGLTLLNKLNSLLAQAGVPAVLDTVAVPPVLDVFFVEIRPKTDVNPRGLSIRIADSFNVDQTAPFEQDDYKVEVGFNADLQVGTEIIIQPNDAITLIPPSGEFKGDAFIKFTGGKENGEPYIILGQTGGSRIEARQFVARVGAGFAWRTDRGEGEFSILGEIKKGKIFIGMDGADGFLAQLLSGLKIESDFDIGLGFSTKDGVFFVGSSTLDIQVPLHVSLGVLELNALTISVGFSADGFPIGLGVDIKAMLGPLQAVVEQIGLEALLKLSENRTGNLGPVDVAFKFKPPKGAGLSLDVGVVKGGGYLFFDPGRGEYAGALELSFAGIVTVKAIGLITTKMPDGSSGFSLLIIITAEFGTGIQLGFGFTLLAVGGLLGLNRTMRLEALTEGVRTGALESVMFPKDIIANAPRIISDLRTFFPPENGKFLIGPMVKIGWGTPTLISISLGIIIEIPGNIAIVGILKVALPVEEAALIVLQVNFIGAIEIDKKRIFFFAALFESRVLFITISGEMGLLVAFGDDANFVVSVGGFHPQFNPPPLPFPNPIRVSLDIINTGLYRITVSGYFAVTSNTVQFGAKAELSLGFSAIKIQGHIGFDVLIQFSPFYFIAQISASVSLKVFGIGLFSIRLSFTLEGPTPWRARGTGSLSLLFFDVSADFDITWGDAKDTSLPPVVVIPLLKAEFEKPDNWRASLPAGNNLLVSLRKLDEEAEGLVLHPVGTLQVRQKKAPLDLEISKLGSQKVSDANRFTLAVEGSLSKKADLEDQFAVAQFQDMDNAKKLSIPAFQRQHSGVDLSISGQEMASSLAVKRIIRYEEIIIDNNYLKHVVRFKLYFSGLFTHFLKGASISQSTLSKSYQSKLKPYEEAITVQQEAYAVAFQQNNQAVNGQTFKSEAQARDFMQQVIKDDPNMFDSVHVIPQYEVMS
ncbi:MAG: DUF6603 domain-containing protein [Chloroflexota bacterium]